MQKDTENVFRARGRLFPRITAPGSPRRANDGRLFSRRPRRSTARARCLSHSHCILFYSTTALWKHSIYTLFLSALPMSSPASSPMPESSAELAALSQSTPAAGQPGEPPAGAVSSTVELSVTLTTYSPGVSSKTTAKSRKTVKENKTKKMDFQVQSTASNYLDFLRALLAKHGVMDHKITEKRVFSFKYHYRGITYVFCLLFSACFHLLSAKRMQSPSSRVRNIWSSSRLS